MLKKLSSLISKLKGLVIKPTAPAPVKPEAAAKPVAKPTKPQTKSSKPNKKKNGR